MPGENRANSSEKPPVDVQLLPPLQCPETARIAGTARWPLPFTVAQRRSLWQRRRVWVWGTSLMVLSWFVYAHTMMVPGYVDRAGRFKGSDYIYFYVMGSLISGGRVDALYEPAA